VANVHDVAAYILSKSDAMSTMKLQKLTYYSQAWHMAWDGVPLFPERIEAWANGPVVYELFDAHRGSYSVATWPRGKAERLTQSERETVDSVLANYGKLTGRQLSLLTHAEDPWRDARAGLPATARSSAEITPDALAEYYGALDAADEAGPVDELAWDTFE
jgi:uncharacterized phage-associated protein